ncbi:MAG: HEPN domain-containing protein [Chloroflexi bacterium]|nr:HEPN domain-containing protein [Chloroflexota bacterium]
MAASDLAAVADYQAQAREFLRKGREYLAAGDLHQASEKGWGAAAHMAKAVAVAQGWEYETHADFSSVLNRATEATGADQLRGLRGIANDLHGNYYRRSRHLDAAIIDRDLESMAELLELLGPLAQPPS